MAWLAALLLALAASAPSGAQGPNRAGLVVQYGDGQVQSVCVEFNEPQISGFELLQRAGLPLSYAFEGGITVCSIGNEGCTYPAQGCFCQCAGIGSCRYWSYHRLEADGSWQYSNVGAATTVIRNGDVDGWRWGAGQSSDAAPPPRLRFADVCAAPPAIPTPPPPTWTPPPPTWTPPPPTWTPPPPTATALPPTPPPAALPSATNTAPASATPPATPPATPTASASAVPPSASPSASPTPRPSTAPARPSATPAATATALPSPAVPPRAAPPNYLAFAALALLLGAGLLRSRWRR